MDISFTSYPAHEKIDFTGTYLRWVPDWSGELVIFVAYSDSSKEYVTRETVKKLRKMGVHRKFLNALKRDLRHNEKVKLGIDKKQVSV